ncbi:MAG TPA: hypothetical protein VEH31_17045 [Streptosporangiaceae bacterium]|nr:hypothetical protein [Streptosporangiaceae bacterium]
MAKPPARRQAPHLLPDLRDWLEVPSRSRSPQGGVPMTLEVLR